MGRNGKELDPDQVKAVAPMIVKTGRASLIQKIGWRPRRTSQHGAVVPSGVRSSDGMIEF